MKTLRRVILEGKLNQPGKQAKKAMRNQEPKGNPPKPPPTIDANPGETPGSARKRAGLRRFRKTAGTTPGRRRELHDRAVEHRRSRQIRAREAARKAAREARKTNPAEGLPTPEQENSNTAYPLTAGRVHIHEINFRDRKESLGHGTTTFSPGATTRRGLAAKSEEGLAALRNSARAQRGIRNVLRRQFGSAGKFRSGVNPEYFLTGGDLFR